MNVDSEIVTITAVVVGIFIEALKPIKWFNSGYAGIVALALGVVFGIGLAFEGNASYADGVVSGIVGAATAAGLYSAVDAAKKARTNHAEAAPETTWEGN